LLKELVEMYGEKIAVGVDTKDGYVATHGWLETSSVKGVDFCKELRELGVATVIYTDISKDGELAGTNLAVYEELCQINGLNVIASGGVTTEAEIAALRQMGAYGAILGKALYAGRLDLSRALGVARGEVEVC
jgi:phosphoribosylformimino-5-aminoimidazole carboxamide ribotide isomerase